MLFLGRHDHHPRSCHSNQQADKFAEHQRGERFAFSSQRDPELAAERFRASHQQTAFESYRDRDTATCDRSPERSFKAPFSLIASSNAQDDAAAGFQIRGLCDLLLSGCKPACHVKCLPAGIAQSNHLQEACGWPHRVFRCSEKRDRRSTFEHL